MQSCLVMASINDLFGTAGDHLGRTSQCGSVYIRLVQGPDARGSVLLIDVGRSCLLG